MSQLEGLSFSQIIGPSVERQILANGLEVIYAHRPGCKLCTVQAWIRAGSIHESKWEGSGISHYLEHMIFKGTGRFTNRELTDAIHKCGATSNAYTTFDHTVYYVDAPQEGFETAVEVISDMVFDPLISESDSRMEKEVILREIAMYEDDHDQVLAKAVLRDAIRVHPLRHPVIGNRDLFIRLTADDLRNYHASRYVTENVVLALGGDIPAVEAFAIVERWFGRFDRKTNSITSRQFEPPQCGERRVTVMRNTNTSKGVACWKIPGKFEKNRMAIDLFLGVLGAGNSSILWSELREKQRIVHEIGISSFGTPDLGLAWCNWTGGVETKSTTVETALSAIIDKALQHEVSDEQFSKVVRQSVVSMVNGQKNLHDFVSISAYAATIRHDILWPLCVVEQLSQMKPSDITEESRRWFRSDNVTFGTLHKKQNKEKASQFVGQKSSDAFEVIHLHNGVRIILQPDFTIPKIGMGIFLSAGGAYEARIHRGITGILSTHFRCDTQSRAKHEVAQLVDTLGVELNENATHFSCGIWAEGMIPDFDTISELVTEGVLDTRIDPKTFETECASIVSSYKESEDDIFEHAKRCLQLQYFGEHPLAIDCDGEPSSIAQISPKDVELFHRRLVVSRNLVVGVTGSYDRDRALELISRRFSVLPDIHFTSQTFPKHKPFAASSQLLYNPGEQAIVALAFPHCGFGPEDSIAADVTQQLLSGMASRLFRRIREEKGMAYFVIASRIEVIDQGMFYICSGTTPPSVHDVLYEIRNELKRIKDGNLAIDEIEGAKRSIYVSRRQRRQSASARMQGAILREIVGLGANYDTEWERKMSLTDSNSICKFANQYLDKKFEQELIVLPKL